MKITQIIYLLPFTIMIFYHPKGKFARKILKWPFHLVKGERFM
jgi:hypothetical protein